MDAEYLLAYSFTDRAGRRVYDMVQGRDIVGQIRFTPGEDGSAWVEWEGSDDAAEE